MNLLNPKFPNRPFSKSTCGKHLNGNIHFVKLPEENGAKK